MGFFTFTDATIPNPTIDSYGCYKPSHTIGYDGYAKVVCPDGREIEEPCYHGYGIFGGHDIYELVVDWNKEYLEKIFDQLDSEAFGIELRPVAIAFQNDGEQTAEEVAKTIDYPLASEWKRTIGIAIELVKEKQDLLCPYPIKVTKSKRKRSYEELHPSFCTQ